MIEDHHGEEPPFEDWLGEWDAHDDEHGPPDPPPWRKPVLIVTAAVTALAVALVPLYNVFFARNVADNGLEVCGFDYCVVVEAVTDAGLDLTMSRLSTAFLDDAAAAELTDAAIDHLDVAPVGLEIVDDLEGRLGGLYDPATREIRIERPARAWTVLHEVAHTRESGHGEDFQRVLIQLARWADTDP